MTLQNTLFHSEKLLKKELKGGNIAYEKRRQKLTSL